MTIHKSVNMLYSSQGFNMNETIGYNGKSFYRHEDYYRSVRHGQLHRYIWECENGQIPEGHIVHHKDGNTNNNNLENLKMMSRSEHQHIHSSNRSIETRAKLSMAFKGRKLSEETKRKISISHSGCRHPKWGKKDSDATKLKRAKHFYKKVMCIETGIIYDSIIIASRTTGINNGSIGQVVMGKRKTAGKCHWKLITKEALSWV